MFYGFFLQFVLVQLCSSLIIFIIFIQSYSSNDVSSPKTIFGIWTLLGENHHFQITDVGYVFKYRISIEVSRLSPSFLCIWNILGVVLAPTFWITCSYWRFTGIFSCTLRIYLAHSIFYIFGPSLHGLWQGLVFISSLGYIIHQILTGILFVTYVSLLNTKWPFGDFFTCIMALKFREMWNFSMKTRQSACLALFSIELANLEYIR